MCVLINAFVLLCTKYDNKQSSAQENPISNKCSYSLYGFCDEEAELDTLSPNLLLAVCVRSIELNSVSSKLCIY